MHPNTLRLGESLLLIVDVQEAFRQSIPRFARLTENIVRFTAGAKALNLPVLVTEQYPKGLGHTATEIADVLPADAAIIEKTAFSSCGAAAFNDKLVPIGAKQIIIAGIEAHICVNQTAHDLLALGYQVHLLSDAIASRTAENEQIAFAKMRESGAILSSVEMALFELMRDAKHEQFKLIQKLIK
ncbi:MAG TPA: hydrolase [Pyrinomonadaceae bacterium]|jgi:nicotinamidase-related amidase|nr:hydrolase [Pyrinomonadaceae bacterium]